MIEFLSEYEIPSGFRCSLAPNEAGLLRDVGYIPLLRWFVPIKSGSKQLRGSYTRANLFASGIS